MDGGAQHFYKQEEQTLKRSMIAIQEEQTLKRSMIATLKGLSCIHLLYTINYCKNFGYLMPLYKRMNAQALGFF